jgi:5-methylcytosine-specific restriction endonuclease McrA
MDNPKHCNKCGQTKNATDFHRDKNKRDGLSTVCKSCRCEATRVWAAANPDRRREYEQANRERQRDLARLWRQRNRDRALATKARHREKYRAELAAKQVARYRKDPEAHRQAGREYARTHKQEAMERHREWRNRPENIAHVRAYSRMAVWRRAFSRDSATQAFITVLRDDPCSYCGAAAPSHIDHIVPASKGGCGEWGNLTAACKSCNSVKKDRPLLRFLLER